MSIPTKQQALAILTPQGAWGVITAGVDKPGPGEILVRVESTALNPIDWKVQATAYSAVLKEYPAILGSDSAGVVAAVGEGVTKFAVGDRVLHQGFFTNRLGTLKQYVIIYADIVTKIPENLTFDQAASVPLGLATAAIGLYNKRWESGGAELVAPWKEGGRGKYAGQPIFIAGGSSSVGQYVIQLAKLSGFSPIITTVSAHNNDLVKGLGATHPIDRKLSDEEIVAAVKKITPKPLKIVFDAISLKATQGFSVDVLSPGGKLVLVLNNALPKERITGDKDVWTTYGTVHGELNREFGAEMYSYITELLSSGDIKPNLTESLPGGLAAGIEGLRRLQNDEVSGRKLIVHPQETSG
ncbi:hypothetical protein EUX98_g2684 [Antrodiella citrinella]|uniref:Enoyl reductase (ER) domain-containing protein n=1 Tax=Antrodiella citrinella TaxID=2447956 RepID=A0A4V3XJ36_9APHY|nr:hypothetical protein EUX98_g2684 [Antrodiella citrinella]